MNRLAAGQRARILHQLVEGVGLRAISRVEEVSINTVTKLLVDAGNACAAYHDETVRGVRAERIQVDEIWSFIYAKQKNVEKAKKAPKGAGDAWTWTAIDADSKLMISWLVGPRDASSAFTFIHDLRDRVVGRPQITSDGLGAYVSAVEDAFGADVDFAQLIKLYGRPATDDSKTTETRYSAPECVGIKVKKITGDPDPAHIATSYVERQNLNLRMGVRRFTRLTNAFGKKLANQVHALALYYVFFNFCRIHKTLRMTPAMASGVSNVLYDVDWIVGLIDAHAPKPQKPGPKPGAKYRPRERPQ